VRRAPTALYWCGNVVIDRRSDQLGEVLVCVHAVTIQYRGRATRSIDHDTHGHRLGQDKAQAGFEGSQEARALDQEVARPKGCGGVWLFMPEAESEPRDDLKP
jgi:hypothetical protein